MTDDASACPLARLCAEAERLLIRRAAAERVLDGASVPEERAHAARVVRQVDLSIAHIAGRASDLVPESRRGALFTLALAAADVETLAAEDSGAAARLRRRLYALRGFLEGGERANDTLLAPIASRFMQVDGDPLSWLAE